MRFEIDVHDTEIVSLLERLLAITRPDPWVRKWRTLEQQARENQFLREWHSERNGIELAFGRLLSMQNAQGKFPVQVQDETQYELYGFAAGVVRIYEQLSAKGKTRLNGMIRDGLQPGNNLLALQHEIVTAVHLVSRGYEVQMNDLEKGSGVDYIASKDGAEIEVECKVFTGDLGRKIHRGKVLTLHRHVADVVELAYKRATGGLLIQVEIPDRLTGQPQQMDAIKRGLSSALLSGTTVVKVPECEIRVLDFEIATSPFAPRDVEEIDQRAIRDFAHKRLGRGNRELMILFAPGKRAVVLQVQSAKHDETLKGAYRQLREAATGQFTKTRPGILTVQFQELTADQLLSIAKDDTTVRSKATGLQVMTSDFLNSPNRGHILGVVYRSHGVLSAADGPAGRSMRSQGPAYDIRNPANPHYNDPRCMPFSSK
jgi:hypothetical protein